MNTEQFDTVHHALPFRPSTIHMSDGRSFFVKHPDFLSRSPSGRTVIVFQDNDSFSILDLRLITEIEVHSPPAPADGATA